MKSSGLLQREVWKLGAKPGIVFYLDAQLGLCEAQKQML